MNSNNQSVFLRVASIPLVLGVVAFQFGRVEVQEVLTLPPEVVLPPPVTEIVRPEPPLRSDLFVFLDAMGFRESSNEYGVVNQYGYMGRYQFSQRTLHALGEEFQVSRSDFLMNPILQDSAMIANLRQNRRSLWSLIRRLEGKTVNGVTITESGLLAGAHLVGAGGVRAWIDPSYTITVDGKEYRPKVSDGNGVKVAEYISEFSGYRLALGR